MLRLSKRGKMRIKKAVIPVAGLGTRFLPFTKAMPKEMLPLVDIPVLQYIVEEAVEAGIEEIILITGQNKRAIEDHFDYSFELEERLKRAGKIEEFKEIRRISDMAKFVYVRQKEPKGNGHAILCAKEVVGNEPFVVFWGDDFIEAKPSRTKQLLSAFEKLNHSVISLVKCQEEEDKSRYGIVEIGQEIESGLYKINNIIEKPGPDKAPSDLFIAGGFVFTPEVFGILEKLKPGKGGEIWLADADAQLAQAGKMYGLEIKNGKYYDTGSKIGYLKTVIDFALKRDDVNGEFVEYLKQLKL